MNKLNHTKVEYVNSERLACLKANDNRFKSMIILCPNFEYFEIRINLDLPIQIGYFILQYAKLRVLEFYYDFLDEYVSCDDFEILQMDTDSCYLSIAGESLDEIVKPELKSRFLKGLNGFCSPNKIKADNKMHWLPRNCCSEHSKYDSRTPGLFKLEYSGDCFYGLCSKTYIVRDGEKHKFSSNRISKKRVKDPFGTFKKVLLTHHSQSSTNIGFITKNNSIYTYQQERYGFTYFYIKRQVLADGISTKPLDIVLQPIKSKFSI